VLVASRISPEAISIPGTRNLFFVLEAAVAVSVPRISPEAVVISGSAKGEGESDGEIFGLSDGGELGNGEDEGDGDGLGSAAGLGLGLGEGLGDDGAVILTDKVFVSPQLL